MSKQTQHELDLLKTLGLRTLGGVGPLLNWLFTDTDVLHGPPIDLLGTKEGRAKIRGVLLKIKRDRFRKAPGR